MAPWSNWLSHTVLIAVAFSFLHAGQGPIPSGKDKGKGAAAPAPAVIAAWKKAGFEFGWLHTHEGGHVYFEKETDGKVGDLPAFQILLDPRRNSLERLPAPDVPFGLSILHASAKELK
jgi:hypothetical protein